MFDISKELAKLPNKPGVYLHHDSKDEIIYIGKAKNLKNRVSQYFQSGRGRSAKIEKMVEQIAYFEYIVTDTEVEALILENNLIKENRPRYNTMLKDDKTYPYIKLTLSEDFPRIVYTRKVKKDKDKYYGPYPQGTSVHAIIDLLNGVYHLRTCHLNLPRDIGKKRPCLNYHIKKCDGICTGFVSKEEYAKKVDAVRRFLEGNSKEIITYIKEQMKIASDSMEYEVANSWKELLMSANAINAACAKQKVEYSPGEDRDVIGLAREGFEAIIQIFFIREGKLLDREHFYLSLAPDETDTEIILSFIKQYYSGSPLLPHEIVLPCEIEDKEIVEEWMGQKAGRKVAILVPQKGQKEKMVELACQNAKLAIEQDKEKVKQEKMRTKGAISEISKMIGIGYAKRVESYDISNISGYLSVGSMVVFEDGRPKKNDYRKFKIKTVVGPDDYASMAEVLTRRFEHSEWERPDLILIDGGRGQVHAVLEALNGLEGIPVCGMVKDDHHRTRGLIYNDKEYLMDASSQQFKLLTRIQDETHRFAIEFHRQLRSKGQVRSVLDDIPGIGPKRRLALIRHFKSIDAVKNASMEELEKVESMDKKAALAVIEFFKN